MRLRRWPIFGSAAIASARTVASGRAMLPMTVAVSFSIRFIRRLALAFGGPPVPARLPVAQADTVKMPLILLVGVMAGGEGSPLSLRSRMKIRAFPLECLKGLRRGVAPSPAGLQGSDFVLIHPAVTLLGFVENVVQLVDVHFFFSSPGVVDGAVDPTWPLLELFG